MALPHTSDDDLGVEAADISNIDDYADDTDWDSDPSTILEQRELAEGRNCWGFPIN